MEFEPVAPRRAEAPNGAVVEVLDRHHAQLRGPSGTWLVELGPGPDEDWVSITVFEDSLLRSGGDPDERARAQALDWIVAGIRALRVRVGVEEVLAASDEVEQLPLDDDQA